ncbi:MAG: insulinase family protein, partial [Candidatus Latescibacterota bacterium]|nr:insulinase family protein [Candidatus Latescibacterota bacterium]
MFQVIRCFSLLLSVLCLHSCIRASQMAPSVANAAPAKHPLDRSEVRHFVLDNRIKVLLVSDPGFNKSAAAVHVRVGTLSNPKDRMGMAHFLEHMLFMGTEKYPEVDDYLNYINGHGGYRNAYTTEDHTAYFFEINHSAFEG